jgi:hypothetical protein
MNEMTDTTAKKALEAFIAKYSPAVASVARAALRKMTKRFPSAVQLVYDNYNALAIGFGPTDRTSDAIFSIAVWPRWVSLFFLNGAQLADPDGLLNGNGSRVRHIVLQHVALLDDARVRALMTQALDQAGTQLAGTECARIIIKSVSAKQRPRRPARSRSETRRTTGNETSKPRRTNPENERRRGIDADDARLP